MLIECEEMEIRGMLEKNERIENVTANKSPTLPELCGMCFFCVFFGEFLVNSLNISESARESEIFVRFSK